jgi:hypothetical protein
VITPINPIQTLTFGSSAPIVNRRLAHAKLSGYRLLRTTWSN